MREFASIAFEMGVFDVNLFAAWEFYIARADNWRVKLSDLITFG